MHLPVEVDFEIEMSSEGSCNTASVTTARKTFEKTSLMHRLMHSGEKKKVTNEGSPPI